MSADDASSNAINDQIIRLFLYGNANGLSDYASESLIRPDGATTIIPIEALTYKDGPGRFAVPELFELVRLFFNAELAELSAGREPDANGEIRITKDELIVHFRLLLGYENFGLEFNQALFDDGQDNYFQRAFIWGTSSFKIRDGAEFVFNAQTGARRIEKFAVVRRPDNDGNNDENFDFEGGNLSNQFVLIGEPRTDPFGIGRTVIIDLGDDNLLPTYTYHDWEYQAQLIDPVRIAARTTISGVDNADPNSAMVVTNGVLGSESQDKNAAVAKLATSFDDYFQRLYQEDVIVYRQDGFDLYYGTNRSDGPLGLNPARNFAGTLIVPTYAAVAEPNPAREAALAALLAEKYDVILNGGFLERVAAFSALASAADPLFDAVFGAPHLSYQNGADGEAPNGAIIIAGAGDDIAIGDQRKNNRIFGGSGGDILIGGHAQHLGSAVLTRDPRFYRTYFATVPLITPPKDDND